MTYYDSDLKEDRFLYLVCFFQYVCADHVKCSSNTRPRYLVWFVFWVFIIFWCRLFESSYFLLFAFFSVEKLLFLFYPHSLRSYLLKVSAEAV